MNLVENLMKCRNKENENIIKELLYCIKEEKIYSMEQLIDFENKIFTIDNRILNTKQRIKYCMYNIENSCCNYDGLSLNEIRALTKLKNNMNGNDEEKILNIIKINSITNREIMFVKEAYEYIIKGIL